MTLIITHYSFLYSNRPVLSSTGLSTFLGRGIRIRTLNDGVRVTESHFQTLDFKPIFYFLVSQKSLAQSNFKY